VPRIDKATAIALGLEKSFDVIPGKYYLIQCPSTFPDEGYTTKGWIKGFDPILYCNIVLECLGKAMYPPRVTEGQFNLLLPYFKCHPKDAKGADGCWAFQPEWIIKEMPNPKLRNDDQGE